MHAASRSTVAAAVRIDDLQRVANRARGGRNPNAFERCGSLWFMNANGGQRCFLNLYVNYRRSNSTIAMMFVVDSGECCNGSLPRLPCRRVDRRAPAHIEPSIVATPNA